MRRARGAPTPGSKDQPNPALRLTPPDILGRTAHPGVAVPVSYLFSGGGPPGGQGGERRVGTRRRRAVRTRRVRCLAVPGHRGVGAAGRGPRVGRGRRPGGRHLRAGAGRPGRGR
ncbi:hypothetical protein C1280_02915 [Gemmata obscuriglobus]|uniref:Uncharacterized protein n=1 Tax=Gemmata obscuriglobus TaxID=114 RepID=A0A2Z3GU36_9BACT|nr:hypothetical protein C1280_02915 [Gemmata obscuriglobus]